MGKGGHRQREDIFTVGLRQTANRELIATGQRLADLFLVLTGQLQAQLIELHLGIPLGVHLRVVFRPRRFAAVYVEGVVAGEIHWPLKHLQCILIAFKPALLRQVIERIKHVEFAGTQLLAEHAPLRHELLNVACQQHVMAVVQQV